MELIACFDAEIAPSLLAKFQRMTKSMLDRRLSISNPTKFEKRLNMSFLKLRTAKHLPFTHPGSACERIYYS